jgi:putative long chain acyl-CoA synthase
MALSATYRPTVSALRAAGIPKSARQAWYFDTGSDEFRRLTPAARADLTGGTRRSNG